MSAPLVLRAARSVARAWRWLQRMHYKYFNGWRVSYLYFHHRFKKEFNKR